MAAYAHPEVLVETDWVADHLNDPNVRIVESDEDNLLYDKGHLPAAVKVDWMADLNAPGVRKYHDSERIDKRIAAKEDSTFKSPEELQALYGGKGVTSDKDVIAYCRIGERSSHTWFVLTYLLGYPEVRNYDGSWTEWGNAVGVPIEKTYQG